MVCHWLPCYRPEDVDGLPNAARRTLVEFVRFMEHRQRRRDEMLLAAMGMRR
ncbi:MAG: hypothetical protein KC933_41260 [Myxococcales bacterium]|nr:hypothetical protein [Myxococcales bacterium]